jgi:hypothetical protein
VDEYDAPLNVRFSSEDDIRRRDTFFKAFYSGVLKDNPAVSKALLAGVFEIRRDSILSGLNNLIFLTVANDHVFGDCFGFTTDEVKNCLIEQIKMDQENADHLLDKSGGIREYYNGYSIGRHQIINPWSFMQFLRTFEIRNYWIKTSSTDALFESIKDQHVDFSDVVESIKGLLTKSGAAQKRLIVSELVPSHSIRSSDKLTKDQLLHFLCMTGYLTYSPLRDESGWRGEVWVPNEEIRLEWKTLLAQIGGFDQFDQIKAHYMSLAHAFCSFDVVSIGNLINQAAARVSKRLACKEHSYQLYIGGILSALDLADSRSLCETGAGTGFSDQLISFDQHNRSVIIEYKHSKSSHNCPKDANAGLKQIFDKNYIALVPNDHEALLIGCAIWSDGKDVNVEIVHDIRRAAQQ